MLTSVFLVASLSLVGVMVVVLVEEVDGAPGHGPHDSNQDPVSRTCDLIKHYHCDFFHDDPQCGTDQRTYRNKCEFSKAHCDLRDLHIAHEGACESLTTVGGATGTGDGGSSGTGSSPKPGGDTVYQFFCQNLSHQQCGADQEILCGSDGVTYTNLCMFEKAKCLDQSLSVTSYLACPSDGF